MLNIRETIPDLSAPKMFRELLNTDDMLILPGAYDALSARMISEMGYKAVATSGASMSASMFGLPDAGFLDLQANLSQTRQIVRSSSVPVIADVDTGYGSAANVYYTTQEIERTGAAGLHLEDQVEPKRCPLLTDEILPTIPLKDAVEKLKCAIDARVSDDFVIIARTDTREDEVWRRVDAFAEAGADAVLTTGGAFSSKDAYAKFIENCPVPLCLPMNNRLAKLFSISELRTRGCRILDVPMLPLFASITAMQESLGRLIQNETYNEIVGEQVSMDRFEYLVDAPGLRRFE